MIWPANLEVISKRPISQHFKKSMMIRILADVIQIWVTILEHYWSRADSSYHYAFHQL